MRNSIKLASNGISVPTSGDSSTILQLNTASVTPSEFASTSAISAPSGVNLVLDQQNIKLNTLNTYSNNLHLLSTKINDPNQIILKTKRNKVSLNLESPNQSNSQISSIFNNNNTKYFDRIDMLNGQPANGNLSNLNTPGSSVVRNFIKPFTNKLNLDIIRSNLINYNFKTSGVSDYNKTNSNLSSIIESSFLSMSILISKPVFHITSSKVVIHLFVFILNKQLNNSALPSSQFLALNKHNFEVLCANLSNYLNKAVEFDLVMLKYPFLESQILANLLGRICDISFKPYIYILETLLQRSNVKNNNISNTISITDSNSIILSFLTGIKIRLAGRLLKQKIMPRQTVTTTQFGSLTRSSSGLLATSRFTTKNRRGTFSISATISHKFF